MVEILRGFITAERIGNWDLHLKMFKEMLPFLAAAGHHLYLKTGYIYLQQMYNLSKTHPNVYQSFCNGTHVVRRSDRFWTGLSADLVIEQVLMRSFKAPGGLTRGRGLAESQRAQWLPAMPACFVVNHAMQEFTDQAFESSHQHKEMHVSRCQGDIEDRTKFLDFLTERNPFVEEPSFRNIETGVVADKSVNVENAIEIGWTLLKKW